ncbi:MULTISPECIES: SDR family oxidoreductase [Massilia]|uniref:NAD(P)H-binding protein n=2 Tax=Massilia TaxID=149698 RepID=A0A7X3G2J6_9BURK|nr:MULTISPECIES: SDR family oxidoreductase [Telluria group]KQY10432.1 NmrA family transcriptional regulator [Massilia sp. Root133]MDN4042735.1 SDR family oxidoreductase [Massilia sp. YIM B02787]MVW62453.1 NAD(P)H-binding protein [Telluria cellulosilytica]
MNIVVIGGTGLIGSKLVTLLRARGHEALAASPNSGVNTLTGEGLDAALEGCDVVVDVANSPSFADDAVLDFFTTSGRNLLAAARRAGVRHHVALSVVGTQRLAESGYFRAKIAQEELIRASGLPYTIVHSTQFFEFLSGIAASAGQDDTIALSPAYIQPIASDDVAAALADVVLGAPVNGIVEIAGPDRFRLSDLVRDYLAVKGDTRTVRADVHARYFGAELKEDTLVPQGAARLGASRIGNWLQAQAPASRLR